MRNLQRSLLLRIFSSVALAASAAIAQDVVPSAEEKALYEKGIQLIEAGKFEQGRLTLETLINVYPDTSLRHDLRAAVRKSWIAEGVSDPDPMLLFQEARRRERMNQIEAARLAYSTLIHVYPSSDYAVEANKALRELQ